jgi:hypothetical protein
MQTTRKINTKTTIDAWVDHKHSTQRSNKNVDINFSVHDVFLELPSSDPLKTK